MFDSTWSAGGLIKEIVQTMQVEIGTVDTKRFSMDYCSFGTGKRTLVILPGLSVQSVMLLASAIAEAYKLLADDFTIYVFDRRKGVLPDTYTIRDMAVDTAAAMEALGLKHVEIFGASQGGMMAMEIAVIHPELVHSLILGSSSGCVDSDRLWLFDHWIAFAKADKATELYLSFGEAVYPKDVFEGAKDALIEASRTVTEAELARFVVLAGSIKSFDLADKLDTITCPVLVIGSRTDAVLGGRASEEIADALKNSADCQLYLYDGYGHAAYDCAPDYRERMLRFLREHEQ